MKAKKLLEDRLNIALISIGVKNIETKTFIIVPTGDEIKYRSFDDIIRFWQTPRFKGIQLKYSDVIKSLVAEDKNLLPLWIKITYQEEMPIRLEISQRFRKCKEVLARNPANEIAPFEIDENKDIQQLIVNERQVAIRILMFSRIINNKLNATIGRKIEYNEIETFFENHFKTYRFYPPLPNHQKPSDQNFSKILIDRNHITGKFDICDALKLDEKILSELTENEAVEFYLKNEMKNKIFKIEINH